MGAAALFRKREGADYLSPSPPPTTDLTPVNDATKVEGADAEHHNPPALKRPSLLKSLSNLFENVTNPLSPTTDCHGYTDLLQQRFQKNIENVYQQNQELRDTFYEFLEKEFKNELEHLIKIKVKTFKNSNKSSLKNSNKTNNITEEAFTGVVEGTTATNTNTISPNENNDGTKNGDAKDLKSLIRHHRDGTMMEITIKEFFQQLMFHFLFQFEASSNNISPISPAIFPSTPNKTDLFIETPFETLFCDYQIDLSDHAHRKASLLALVKNRQIAPNQRAYSHGDLESNVMATIEELILNNNEIPLVQTWQNPFFTVEQCIDFLFLFFFSIYQEIYKHSYYELIIPSTLPHTSSFTLRIVRRLSKELKIWYEAPDEDGEEDSSHTRGLYSSSHKKFVALEQQTSDQIHFQRYQGLNQSYDHVFSLITKSSVDYMDYGSSGKWCETSNFLQHLDELGVALTIASVEKDGCHFPLIHVNSAFERLTQYNRNEVTGKCCCSLLEGAKTEKGQKEKVRKALESGRAMKVGIMNHKKDGSSFLNLLSLVPIYDRNGEYRYVVGKLEDVSSHTTTMKSVEYGEDVVYWVGLVLRCL